MFVICLFLSLVGTIQANIEGFIVGGDHASIKKHAHSAFLTIFCVEEEPEPDTSFWECGSSIINQQILISAAHCVYSCSISSRIMVHMGDANHRNGILKSVSEFIFHEKYNPESSFCDISMIKLTKPVSFNSKVSRVAIMKSPPYNEPATLAGWGETDEKLNTYENNLKSIDQKVWRHRSCEQMLGSVPRGTICASSLTLKNYAAGGDSGSALVVRGYIQIGLVSYKVPSLANNVIIYSDVGYHYDWIVYNSKRLYCYT